MTYMDPRTVGAIAKAATSLHLLAEHLIDAANDADPDAFDLYVRSTRLRDDLEAIITHHLEGTS